MSGESGGTVRLSRPCYDKYHRCPGQVGGGMKYAKRQRCKGGRIVVDYERPLWRWRFHRCDTCGVIVLPYHSHWLDPTDWNWRVRWQLRRLRTQSGRKE